MSDLIPAHIFAQLRKLEAEAATGTILLHMKNGQVLAGAFQAAEVKFRLGPGAAAPVPPPGEALQTSVV